MQIRVFEAISMQDAVKKVKSHLGKDAIILSSEETTVDDSGQKGIRVRAAASQSYDDDFSQHISGEILTEIKKLENLMLKQNEIAELFGEFQQSIHSFKNLEDNQREIRNLLTLNYSDKFKKSLEVENRNIATLLSNLSAKGLFSEHIMELKASLEDFERSTSHDQDTSGKIKSVDSKFELLQAYCLKWVLSEINIYRNIEQNRLGASYHAFIGPGGEWEISIGR